MRLWQRERDELTTNLWQTDCDGDVLLAPEQIANRVDAFSKLRAVANYNPLECEQGIASAINWRDDADRRRVT